MGRKRGQLTQKDERVQIIELIEEACESGARQKLACDIIGITCKTYQRWSREDNLFDGRLTPTRIPANKLTELECQRVIKLVNESDYAHLAPSQIIPILADKGIYIACESTFYRVLKAHNQSQHRQKAKPNRQVKKPKALCATGPNQLYSWDISYLPTVVRGIFVYLYLVMDVFSRKIVGWQVYEEESSALAADLMKDICLREGVPKNQVILHSDNGSPMKGATMLATLQQLGIMPSLSRPSVSNDNPYSESLFRTLKYRPEYPEKPFDDLNDARNWMVTFVQWYNEEHRHSGIKFVTPGQRHRGEDIQILVNRKQVYAQAKLKNPNRWSGNIRNWDRVEKVYLNPEKEDEEIKTNKAA